jgi:ABC-type transport system substrate-binding protein
VFLFWGAGLGALLLSPAIAATHTVTINTVQIFGTIDPAKISDYTDYMASANLYDGLVNVDSKGALIPELADKWEVSPDATSVTFHIRPDAKFQDGSPAQAEDVVYSVERLLKINQGRSTTTSPKPSRRLSNSSSQRSRSPFLSAFPLAWSRRRTRMDGSTIWCG